jgi:hypothetical protein
MAKREIRYVVAVMMPGAFQPLTPAFATRTEAEAALAAIPAWKQRRKDLKAKIRRNWYITGMENVVAVYEDGAVLEAVV